jgi:hypothetical protein
MRAGLFSMLQGASITLLARRSELVDRRLLAKALHQSSVLGTVLKGEDLKQLQKLLTGANAKETDPQIRADLEGALAGLKSAIGTIRP